MAGRTHSMITSVSNNRIKEARKLQRRRDRYAQGQLLIEGVRLVRDAWQAGVTLHHVFYAPELLAEQSATIELIAQLEAAQVELLPCSASVFATLSETVTPQGIAATVALPDLPVPELRTLTLLLDRVRDPGNAGTLLRSAAAAGVDLALFGPESVDPFNDKVMRAGMGAHFRLPVRSLAGWEEAAMWMDGTQPLYLAEAVGEIAYDAVDWTSAAILAVGGEANGASEWVRRRATAITIPMQAATESLNAAVAGSVILFEAARQRRLSSKRSATWEAR
jgi:TrmH family RNA methyltransferase